MIIKEFNFLLKDTKSASEIKNSILPKLNLKACSENIGYIAKVYDTQSKKIYLLVSDNVKNEKSLSNNIFEIGNCNTECSSSVKQISNQTSNQVVQESIKNIDEETIKNIVKETLNANLLKANETFIGNGPPSSNPSLVSSANNGDIYLDSNASEIYIKNNDTWQKINTKITEVDDQAQGGRLVNNVKDVNSISAKTWFGKTILYTSTTDPGMHEVKAGDFYHYTPENTYYVCTNISGNTITWKSVSRGEEETEYPKVESNAVFGDIGGLGAGVAYLPKIAATVGLTPMSGANDKANENFGNFVDSNDNVFVCIPLMFYKADTDTRNEAFYNKPNIYISYVPKEGYAPFYAFKKSDNTYVPCVFVSKYIMAISNAKAISKKNQNIATSIEDPFSYIYDVSIAKISGCKARNDHFFKAAKSMNDNTVLHYAALRFVYYMVAEAHMQAAVRKFGSISDVPEFICAYLDVEPYFPKGCTDKSSDINDKSIKYERGILIDVDWGMTGSCNKPEKTSFNGQKCGIVDMGGLVNEVDAGYITVQRGGTMGAEDIEIGYEEVQNGFMYDDEAKDGTFTYALKGIDLVKSLDENTFLKTKNYIRLNLKNRRRFNVGYNKVGNGENPIFSFSSPNQDEPDTVNDYNCDNFLNPLENGMSKSGAIAYGLNYNSKLRNWSVPVFGGSGDNGSGCGLLYFNGYGIYWTDYSGCSARTMIVPEVASISDDDDKATERTHHGK